MASSIAPMESFRQISRLNGSEFHRLTPAHFRDVAIAGGSLGKHIEASLYVTQHQGQAVAPTICWSAFATLSSIVETDRP